MKIIALKGEQKQLDDLVETLLRMQPGCMVTGFTDAKQALVFAHLNGVDAAFLSVEPATAGGLELARQLRESNPACNVIVLASDAGYAMEAFAMRCSGYLLEPVAKESLQQELDNLRYPIEEKPDKRINVQTFGNFEVFADGKAVRFGRSKSKELLAYLVDRKGAAVSIREAAGVLWEDEDLDASGIKQIQTIISEMLRSLRQAEAGEIVIRHRNALSVDPSRFDCDYYRMLDGDIRAVNAYTGEYMTNYSWAEYTTGYLNNKD